MTKSIVSPTAGAKRIRKPKPVRLMTLAEANALGDAIKDLAVRLDRGGIAYSGIDTEVCAPLTVMHDGRELWLTEQQQLHIRRKPSLRVRGAVMGEEALAAWRDGRFCKWEEANLPEIEAAGYVVQFAG